MNEFSRRKTDYDAIIVGAGPAGSTAAILLAQAGWSVAVIEKSTFPRRKVCGECVAATNLSLLDRLGIGQQFDDLAGPELRSVGLFAGAAMLIASSRPRTTAMLVAWVRRWPGILTMSAWLGAMVHQAVKTDGRSPLAAACPRSH
ncbi:MAG: FAD-dependent oxidoreductase [Metallibacterium sp.]